MAASRTGSGSARQLIVALYRSGRQADALEAYADARRTLIDELGTEPGRELQELQRAVLRQDPRARRAGGRERLAAQPQPRGVAQDRHRARRRRRRPTTLRTTRRPGARRCWSGRVRPSASWSRHGAAVTPLGGGRLLGVFGVPVGAGRRLAAGGHGGRRAPLVRPRRPRRPRDRRGRDRRSARLGRAGRRGGPAPWSGRAGEVLAAARTWRLVRHAVTAAPRDGAWAIDAVDPDAAPLLRRLETPLVGRERELGRSSDAFERAAAEGRPHLVTVFGAPGVGKTRLAVECRGAPPRAGDCRSRPLPCRRARRRPTRRSATCSPHSPAATSPAWIRERLVSGRRRTARRAAGRRRRARRRDRAHRRTPPSRPAGCSPASRASGPCCSSSRTCTGPRPRSSTSSSRSSSSPRRRCSCSASHVPTCWTSGRTGAAGG